MTGFDLSEKMLAKAASMTTDPDITWLRADLETLQLPAAQSDVIYSSLALHYLRDILALFATLFQALVAGGSLIFPQNTRSTQLPSFRTGVRIVQVIKPGRSISISRKASGSATGLPTVWKSSTGNYPPG